MIDGVDITISGETFTVPPLNLSGIEKYLVLAEELAANPADPKQQLNLTAEMVMIALRRNYPDMTAERVKDLLDFRNAPEVLSRIGEISGLKKKQEPEIPVSDLTG